MNLLNRSYFSDDQLATALGRARDSLAEGGWLAVGSNEEAGSAVDGAIYRLRGGRFERRFASGRGSAIEELVRAARA